MEILNNRPKKEKCYVLVEKNVNTFLNLFTNTSEINIHRIVFSPPKKIVKWRRFSIEFGAAKYKYIFSEILKEIFQFLSERKIIWICELIPQTGYSYEREISNLNKMILNKHHEFAIKTLHPEQKFKFYNDPFLQYILDIKDERELNYLIKNFSEADQMKIFIVDSYSKTEKLFETLKENFLCLKDNYIKLFEIVSYIIFFCYDGCHIYIESASLDQINNIMSYLNRRNVINFRT